MALPLIAFLAAAGAAVPELLVVAPLPRALPGAVVPDALLATMRGGVRLPNGLDLSLGIDIQTWVDGQLALHTVYASDGARPGIRVYTDGATPVTVPPPTQTIAADAVVGTPLLIVDRSPTGTTIVPASGAPATTVNLVDGDPSTWLSGANQTQVAVTANGPAVDAPPGAINLTTDADGAVVTLRTPTLEVRQLIGQAAGVIVANTASDRTIETVSAVNVDLSGLTPGLLSGTFMAERAAMDAVIAR